MANPSKVLGRGLGALPGDDVMTPDEENTCLYLPICQEESCSSQPRKQFDPDALGDLADSIRIARHHSAADRAKAAIRLLSDHRR